MPGHVQRVDGVAHFEVALARIKFIDDDVVVALDPTARKVAKLATHPLELIQIHSGDRREHSGGNHKGTRREYDVRLFPNEVNNLGGEAVTERDRGAVRSANDDVGTDR